MPIEIVTALIAALVALITTTVTATVAWKKIIKESGKWLLDLRSSVEIEQYKLRVKNYEILIKLLSNLTSKSPLFNPKDVHETGASINTWLYSSGGLCSDKNTYAAAVGLRNACTNWKEGGSPSEIWTWRDLTINCMRSDLYQQKLDKFDFEQSASYLKRLQDDVQQNS